MYESFEKLASHWARSQNLSGFDVRINADWASNQRQHRELIRSELQIRTQVDLSDLAKPPSCSSHSISISHCPRAGGFIICTKPKGGPGNHPGHLGLGFDLEDSSRIITKVVQRISSQKELDAAPSSAYLWCAKEAAFKALVDFNQPTIISELTIGAWAQVEFNCEEGQTNTLQWTYQLVGIRQDSSEPPKSTPYCARRSSSGVVLEKNGLIAAFFCHFSQT